jgi:NitT/TauT family transport system substrate-binding protein
VPVGGSGELFMREMLTNAGLSITDVTMVNVDPELVLSRLSDDLAAGYVWAPYDQEALRNGHRILYSSASAQTASLIPDLIVFRSAVLAERPDDARAFVNAWFEALDYRLAHPEECNEIIARITGLSIEDVAYSTSNKLYTKADNLKLFDKKDQANSIYNVAQVNLDFMILRGDVTISPNLDEILDSSYL